MIPQPAPAVKTYRLNMLAYLEDMNSLLSFCHTLRFVAVQSFQTAAIARRREDDYLDLLEECNRLGHLAQMAEGWRVEAERYLEIIASLIEELERCENALSSRRDCDKTN